ncbi:hypothetical protein K2173_004191 [Erythroxylum novogranatense]|uniref:Uncharacterized protein n=1 Tax=Erythroxylum novogranatense TaxID=1862640 RepID=A0AAV8SYH4_9ROSI|nr:hypothetical protein K2173_004191 [Erythroxylum novogranatense]
MVAESWFRSLWKIPRKHESVPDKASIGVLAFEVASLMSKVVHLWQSLSDKQISKLRDEIQNSAGIKKLVSEDEEFIGGLIRAEMIESTVHVAKSVARISKKCSDSSLKSFEHLFEELLKIGADPYGWTFTCKKMDKKVKKMEHFVSVNATLHQEMEMLADLEQTVRRMKGNNPEPDNLLDYQKKLVWKQQEVKNLREISLWNRTYDYAVYLLVKSLFTIFRRINNLFGYYPVVCSGDSTVPDSDYFYRGQSVSALLHPPVHPSENAGIPRFSSGPLDRFPLKSGPVTKSNMTNNFYSGPLGSSATKSGHSSGRNTNANFFSGPIERPIAMSGPISSTNKRSKKIWRSIRPPSPHIKTPHSKTNRLTQVGPFKGCMVAGNNSPVANCHISSAGIQSGILDVSKESNSGHPPQSSLTHASPSIFNYQSKLLAALPDTLGAAALALHYANVIIVIEKLAASPHLIGHDARDDLYNMLPESVRSALRDRLKPYSKNLASSVYDTVLAGEWTEAMASILEWLAPLAHNMIKWQSERSFEQQNFVSRTNVLLVQTLYFANQEKTEATITELLVGLNYVWRLGRELNAKALKECAGNKVFDEFTELDK